MPLNTVHAYDVAATLLFAPLVVFYEASRGLLSPSALGFLNSIE